MVAMTVFRFKLSLMSAQKSKHSEKTMKNIDESEGTRHKDTRSGDNIRSLTESTCISVESLEDGTFYEDDNDEFVATLSEMSDCQAGQNYSDDELLDEYCRENELRYKDNQSPAGCF